VAIGLRARLLGLAFLNRERAGAGLLIPRCSSVHTFGMRFPLTLVFLDHGNDPIAIFEGVPRRRLVSFPGSAAVLELSGPFGGRAAVTSALRKQNAPSET
jgi:hypothetical protein